MEERYKPDHGKCNVYITVNCCKDEKRPCHDKDECKECNVYITVNCCKEEERPY